LHLEEIDSSFCAVSRTYYRVKESPLYEHRDVCSAMRINIRFRFALRLLGGKWLYNGLRLPAQEMIGHVLTTIGNK